MDWEEARRFRNRGGMLVGMAGVDVEDGVR